MMFQVTTAMAIAKSAHRGQTDKTGKPYIGHPERVAARVSGRDEKTVAWLHDVVEDSDWTLDDLRDYGFSERVIEAVDAISHRPGEPRDDYYQRVKANPLALTVKFADIADNTDPLRMEGVRIRNASDWMRLVRKYDHALEVLRG